MSSANRRKVRLMWPVTSRESRIGLTCATAKSAKYQRTNRARAEGLEITHNLLILITSNQHQYHVHNYNISQTYDGAAGFFCSYQLVN
jgi:hypothetical protein